MLRDEWRVAGLQQREIHRTWRGTAQIPPSLLTGILDSGADTIVVLGPGASQHLSEVPDFAPELGTLTFLVPWRNPPQERMQEDPAHVVSFVCPVDVFRRAIAVTEIGALDEIGYEVLSRVADGADAVNGIFVRQVGGPPAAVAAEGTSPFAVVMSTACFTCSISWR
jgi:hypothetical protein